MPANQDTNKLFVVDENTTSELMLSQLSPSDIKTRILKAIDENNIDLLIAIQKHSIESSKLELITSPIHIAVERNKVEIVKQLILTGISPDLQLPDRTTPIHLTALSGSIELIKTLIAAGAKINSVGPLDSTAIHYAAFSGEVAAVNALLQAKANVYSTLQDGQTVMHIAAKQGHAEVIRILAAAGVSVNSPVDEGITPLYMAVTKGHIDAIIALNNVGVNVDAPCGDENKPPVFIAAEKGLVGSIEALKNAGANLDNRAFHGLTPLYVAVTEGHEKAIIALKNAGVNVDAPCSDENKPPVFIAAEKGLVKSIEALKNAGANLDNKAFKGVTPLMAAVINKQVNAIVALKIAGADLALETSETKRSAAYFAIKTKNIEVLKALKPIEVVPNKPQYHGKWLMHEAVRCGTPAMIRELFASGISLTSKCLKITPLELARSIGKDDMIITIEDCLKNRKSRVIKTPETTFFKKEKPQRNKPSLEVKTIATPAKIASSQTLFTNVLRTREAPLSIMLAKIGQTEETQHQIINDIKESTDILINPLRERTYNSRISGLELNQQTLVQLKTDRSHIKHLEGSILNFSQLYDGLTGKLNDTQFEQLKIELRNSSSESKQESATSFTLDLFTSIIDALSADEPLTESQDDALKNGLKLLNQEWASIVETDISLNGFKLKFHTLAENVNERKERHKTHKERNKTYKSVTVAEDNQVEKANSLSRSIATLIKELEPPKVIIDSPNTTTKESPAPASSSRPQQPLFRIHAPSTITVEIKAENSAPEKKKLTKNERRAAYELNKKTKEQAKQRMEQSYARYKQLRKIIEGIETFPVMERSEAKTAGQPNVLLRAGKIELYNELEQFKIVLNIAKARSWDQTIQYAILKNFACLNELVGGAHWDESIQMVAKDLRNLIFSEPNAVLKLADSKEKLLDVVSVWIKFLETEFLGVFVDKQAVLNNIEKANTLIVEIHKLKQTLSQSSNMNTNVQTVRQMQAFINQCQTNDTLDEEAVRFCWAVTDKKLKELLATPYNPVRNKALKEFKPVLACLGDLREEATDLRHRGKKAGFFSAPIASHASEPGARKTPGLH